VTVERREQTPAERDGRAAPDASAGSGSEGHGDAEVKRRWHYPSREEHPDEQIFIYRKWCKSCGICYSMCPKNVLTADKAGAPVVSDPDACIACGLCEILCPDMAITVHKSRGAGRAGKSAAEREAVNGDASRESNDE
jgi:2-oxoglutarate ferredoxin oxidoreductase subunit delta